MLPLAMTAPGDTVMVSRVTGEDSVRKHLEDLGFVVGDEIRVVSAPGNGGVIVRVKESTLAVTAKMAEKISVTPVHSYRWSDGARRNR